MGLGRGMLLCITPSTSGLQRLLCWLCETMAWAAAGLLPEVYACISVYPPEDHLSHWTAGKPRQAQGSRPWQPTSSLGLLQQKPPGSYPMARQLALALEGKLLKMGSTWRLRMANRRRKSEASQVSGTALGAVEHEAAGLECTKSPP